MSANTLRYRSECWNDSFDKLPNLSKYYCCVAKDIFKKIRTHCLQSPEGKYMNYIVFIVCTPSHSPLVKIFVLPVLSWCISTDFS